MKKSKNKRMESANSSEDLQRTDSPLKTHNPYRQSVNFSKRVYEPNVL